MATSTKTMQHEMFSARRFIGKDVFDINGEHVGEVEDLVLNIQTACAQWGIVSTGGVLGIGEKYRIVPIQALSIESDTGRLMLQFGGDRLGNGPMYDRNNPPNWSDDNWQRSVKSFYGIEAGGGMGGEQAYQQGYEQGYQQAMQGSQMQGGEMQRGAMRGGSMQGGQMQRESMQSGQMQERRMSSSSSYTGTERRHTQQGGQGQMRPIGGGQSSMQRGSMQGEQQGQREAGRGDKDWLEHT